MPALPQKPTNGQTARYVRFVPILLQKSPRRSCRIKIRNNRIGANGFLNQRCALTPDLESILRTQTGKILLQQNLPRPVIALASERPYAAMAASRVYEYHTPCTR